MMAAEATSTAEEDMAIAALYDLEFRETNDDAWYSVYVVLDAHSEKLTVKYYCTPAEDESFAAGDFETEEQVHELLQRFRPISAQLQDDECRKLEIGTVVCASYGEKDTDLRFFDAVVEEVYHKEHSFTGGEEVCLCTFLLFWQHGRGRGTLTSATIESICLPQSFAQVDPRISAFAVMAKEKIASRKSTPALDHPRSTSIGLISCYDSWNSQDEDMGPEPYNADGLAKNEGQQVILIYNLEKDLNASTIQRFIYKETNILPKAFVFPKLLSEPFARGVIVVDSMSELQIIDKFLDNPNYLIVSSRGRPWVIAEKALVGTSKTSFWSLIPKDMVETQYNGPHEELQVASLGTEAYRTAKQLKDLVSEFIHHEIKVCERLVSAEENILNSFQPTDDIK